MIIEPMTVSQVLTLATDSVTLINSINTNASAEPAVDGMTQVQINNIVDKNIRHLETVLLLTPANEGDNTPDVKGSSEDKSSYTTAIATGKAYIEAN